MSQRVLALARPPARAKLRWAAVRLLEVRLCSGPWRLGLRALLRVVRRPMLAGLRIQKERARVQARADVDAGASICAPDVELCERSRGVRPPQAEHEREAW